MYKGDNDDLERELRKRRRALGLEQMDAGELTLRRKDLGLTQAQLGEKLGVARNTIARWENEKMTFLPLLVDLALGNLEQSRKKNIRQLEREKKAYEKRHGISNGTGGESTESDNETMSTLPPFDSMLTFAQVAEILAQTSQLTKEDVLARLESGKLKGKLDGENWKVERDDLHDFIKSDNAE